MKHTFEKSIYEMELHEELIEVREPPGLIDAFFDSNSPSLPLRILRVPGGWIYYSPSISSNGTFVEWHNEYEKQPDKFKYTEIDLEDDK